MGGWRISGHSLAYSWYSCLKNQTLDGSNSRNLHTNLCFLLQGKLREHSGLEKEDISVNDIDDDDEIADFSSAPALPKLRPRRGDNTPTLVSTHPMEVAKR